MQQCVCVCVCVCVSAEGFAGLFDWVTHFAYISITLIYKKNKQRTFNEATLRERKESDKKLDWSQKVLLLRGEGAERREITGRSSVSSLSPRFLGYLGWHTHTHTRAHTHTHARTHTHTLSIEAFHQAGMKCGRIIFVRVPL